MKRSIQFFAAILVSGTLLVSCQPDNVNPSKGAGNGPSLSGSIYDPHPELDTECQFSDSLVLAREETGSLLVDKCYGFGGVPVQCPSNGMKWGCLMLNEGYIGDQNVIDFNFTLAPGWYCDFNNWKFGVSGSFLFDQTGVPTVTNDWGTKVVNPVQNKWQLRIPVENLPSPSFDVALRVGAVRLNLYGAVTPGSATTLWGRNTKWDDVTSPARSTSPYLMHFTPARCMDQPPLVESCFAYYTGIPELGSATISADISGLTGTLSYLWSTGATTQSITVSPTQTTRYDVTISSDGVPVRRDYITVNYVDVSCAAGNSPQHKVWVCHLPPGNPSNQQEICIDWSGVPAHVERFRSPGSNPHQGHDSGCEIGRCGSNPCL